MNTIFKEEKETVFGVEWFEITKTDTDIYSIYVGAKEPDKDGTVWDNFAHHTLTGENITKLYNFTHHSVPNDSLVLEHTFFDTLEHTKFSLISSETEFHVEVFREIRKKKLFGYKIDYTESYSYVIKRSVLRPVTEQMQELYLSRDY